MKHVQSCEFNNIYGPFHCCPHYTNVLFFSNISKNMIPTEKNSTTFLNEYGITDNFVEHQKSVSPVIIEIFCCPHYNFELFYGMGHICTNLFILFELLLYLKLYTIHFMQYDKWPIGQF